MASSLVTSGIENGSLRSFVVSFLAHVLLAGVILFMPTPRQKVYLTQVPRSVKLIATLEAPPVPKPAPVSKPRPKVVKPVAVKPKAVSSKIKIPVKAAPPLVKPRKQTPAQSPLQNAITRRIADIKSAAVEPAPPRAPDLKVPEMPPAPAVPSTLPQVVGRQKIMPLSDFPYPAYNNKVLEAVSRWEPPSSRALGGRKKAVVVSFRISKDGRVSRRSLDEKSDNSLLDQSIRSFLENMLTLPPLPANYKEDYLDVSIRINIENG